ncbi:N-acetylmuramoyl-L-alanine amidase [Streptomyces parvulus]|uniref:N-acetylmuramoyl-L-alanine amidase n=1 Tax=Streptomyces parvulus TaxID=146923 RepID=UPI0033BCB8A1
MAWYPGAVKMELQPESDAQQAIRPTQFIVHSIVGPWTARRTYEYWRDSTNLESHFGIGYAGDIAQYIGTETRADANAAANRRSDGTGAISVETASNLTATDPWTDEQVEELIKAGVWAHQRHGIPLRLCRWASDPGFGWHKMHAAWNPSAHSCPGPARIRQFQQVVFPGIVARATGKTAPEKEALVADKDDVKTLAKTDGVFDSPDKAKDNPHWTMESYLRYDYLQNRDTLKIVRSLATQVAGLTATVNKLAQLAGSDVDTAQVVDAVERAIADAVVKVDVDITGTGA